MPNDINAKNQIEEKIKKLEQDMLSPDFWNDKNLAQSKIKELQDLKDQLIGVNKYDKGNAVITISAGVGGDDAEDWVRILYEMYSKYAANKNYQVFLLHDTPNDHNGYKNISFEIKGKNIYKDFKNEAGTHRLVRISPFNSNGKRQTSFAMVEVLPEFQDKEAFKLNPDDLEISFTKASGPGGQNVNKRETAVRIKHIPTGISVFVSNERSQQQNKDKGIEILSSKLYTMQEAEKKESESEFSVAKNTNAEWGSQIRSYVFHPYQLVKDYRSGYETSSLDKILGGEIDDMIKSIEINKD